jgi:proline iminopeptidase
MIHTATAALLGVLVQASPVPTPSPAVSEGFFAGSGGTRLFHRRVGSGARAIVFLHGGPGSNFRGIGEFIEPLAGPGRMVVLYDQRGGGRSELVTDPALLTAEHHVRDLEALRAHLGVEKMALVGLSWGAALAALYTAEHPQRVERLVLVSPMAPAKKPFFTERLARLDALRGPAASARRAEILATLGSLGDWDLRPKLEQIETPALVLEGERTNVPLDATREWAVVLPNSHFLLIPNAGHEMFLEEPEEFIAALKQFLAGRVPRGAEVVPGPDAH